MLFTTAAFLCVYLPVVLAGFFTIARLSHRAHHRLTPLAASLLADGAVTTAVASAFFQRVPPFATGRLVLVLDSHRKAPYQAPQQDDPDRREFVRLAREAGATVVDTEPIFRAHINNSPLTLDVSPSDAHLNPLGIGLAMRAAAPNLARP